MSEITLRDAIAIGVNKAFDSMNAEEIKQLIIAPYKELEESYTND